MASIRTAWRIGPLLEPGERLIWVDRAADRRLAWLLAVAASLGLGAAAAVASGDLPRVAVVVVALLLVLTVAYALRGPSRPSYAATDRGRAFVVEQDRTLVFQLPETIEVRSVDGRDAGELDLGTLEVRVHPEDRNERLPVRLSNVARPREVAERLRRRAPAP